MKTWRILKCIALGAALAPFVLSLPSQAQQALNEVEVLVNDEPISSFDINQRLRLVIAIAGGVSSEEEFNRVREQVIQAMVDERLQLQEAAEFELDVPIEQLNEFFARRAEGTGQSPEQFEAALKGIGSSKATMLTQINAEFVWSQLVDGRLGNFVSVSDEEVENYINRIKSNRGKAEHLVAEIVLLVDNPSQTEGVAANARELVARIRQGSNFSDIAQQLSASPTASRGGDLGWLTESDMNSYQLEALAHMDENGISDPVRTAGGYLILHKRDTRRVLTTDALDDEILVKQLLLRPNTSEIAARREHFLAEVEKIRAEETHCDAVEGYAERAGADGSVDVGGLVIRALPKALRDTLVDQELHVASEPFFMDDGIRVIFICDRRVAEVQEPDFERIHQQLEQQRLSMMGRRYLRDLRRKAIVDYP